MSRFNSKSLLHQFLPLLLILHFTSHKVRAQSRCYSGIESLQNIPLPSTPSNVDHLSPEQGKQVIVPGMRFECAGSVTSWSAHTSVLTLENFVEFLTHTVTFQVWRPSQDGRSYTLVGSNELRFSGAGLRNNITQNPDEEDADFFSFISPIAEADQIFFLPGDVVGWFSNPQASVVEKPLSPLFRDPVPSDCERAIVSKHYVNATQQECVACDFVETAEVITGIVPLVAVTTAPLGQESTCSQVCPTSQPFGTTTTAPETTPFQDKTTPNGESATTSPESLGQAQQSTMTTSDVVCIILAAFTLVLHVILILLCAINLVFMKQLKSALTSKTMAISPKVKSPVAFNLDQIKHSSNKPTPADYEAVAQPTKLRKSQINHERVDPSYMEIDETQKLARTMEGDDSAEREKRIGSLSSSGKMGGSLNKFIGIPSPTPLNNLMGGGSETSIDHQQADSRTGSRVDLLGTQPRKVERSMI